MFINCTVWPTQTSPSNQHITIAMRCNCSELCQMRTVTCSYASVIFMQIENTLLLLPNYTLWNPLQFDFCKWNGKRQQQRPHSFQQVCLSNSRTNYTFFYLSLYYRMLRAEKLAFHKLNNAWGMCIECNCCEIFRHFFPMTFLCRYQFVSIWNKNLPHFSATYVLCVQNNSMSKSKYLKLKAICWWFLCKR